MKKLLLSLCLLVMVSGIVVAQTSLQGKVIDANNGEPILFGTVAIYKDGALLTGVETDLDGNYYFSDLNPGTYDVEASYTGYTAQRQTGVVVKKDKTNQLNFEITEGTLLDLEVEIKAYRVPLIEIDNTTSGGTVTSEEIASLPTKSVTAIAATTAGIAARDGDEDVSIRGARESGTVYYIDGIRVTNANLIPQSEIEQLQVITGGIEAKYGDVTGGLISLTTKGPSEKYSAGIEIESSELTDPYGYNLLSANVSGPLLKRNDKSILGFRLSGQFRKVDDSSPSAVGVYRATEEAIDRFEANPTQNIESSVFPSAESYQTAELLDARPNETNTNIDFTAKLDYQVTDNIDVTFSGSYADIEDYFGGRRTANGDWAMFNWRNNPINNEQTYRGSFRFRHKIGRQGNDPNLTDEEKAEMSKELFRNLGYTIQVGYEKRNRDFQDSRLGDRLFEYGYFGRQERSWSPTASAVSDTSTWQGQEIVVGNQFLAHQGSLQQDGEFTPSEINAVLSKYNNLNGLPTSSLQGTYRNLYQNVGSVYNTYFEGENEVYNGQLSVGFDLVPGGSEKGRHNIQLGVLYEQRINRGYNIAPRRLWTAARINANNHIAGVNTDVPIGTFEAFDTTFVQYQNAINPNADSKFYKSVRELLGDFNELKYEYVNVDALTPDQLSLGMFSAREINDEQIVNYYGYDYTGQKLSGDVAFDDFWTSTDANGVRDFKVGAQKPIYGAAYIQDKFAYKDIIFRIGVRADYYDANTKVLKDPYSLYDIQSAKTFFDNIADQTKPTAVGDDYKVYVASEGSEDVLAYRSGDTWYAPNGTATNPGLLFNGRTPIPAYVAGEDLKEITETGFDVDGTFEDYEPQLNFMPRLAFSFPISDDAGFFAHYDVLYQRPTSNTLETPLDYFYMGAGDVVNNPNLKPVRTVDYEVGYKQKLTNSSAMTLAAYYREQRDMIQRRVFSNLPSPIFEYETYDNLDFGTVKGFSFTYDRRRVNNLRLTATYTLQFADGSGSDANSSSGINSRGPIRNLIPLSYDERHRITSTIDYRYGSGGAYTGPRIGGKDIFSNMGLNLIMTAISGRPYTRRRTVQPFGGVGYIGAINGARLPWNFTVDARLDKSFTIKPSESGRPLNFNVYVRVQNLLDADNIYGVYPVTGSAEDDGYLLSTFGQNSLQTVRDNGQSEEAYLAQYNYRLLAPGFYSLARRIYLGATISF